MNVSFGRRARFGVKELVQLIADAGSRVHQRHKGVPLQVGDLSRYSGGRIDNHGSHQNGRDVDFAFYMLDGRGNSVKPTEFVPFDKNGYSIKPPMVYRFDDRRNWTLVASMLRSKQADVQWIFISEALKKRLLAEAEARGEPEHLLARARQIMKQPRESAHWDHFHVRILCPPGHYPECRDVGPTWGRARR